MSRRRWVTWLVFGLCALLVVDVLGWATWRVLRLERAERLASAEADAGRRERLALWQMDSLVGAVVARESARPYFVYLPEYAADKPYEDAWETSDAAAVRPSPLALGTGDPLIRLHYQAASDGALRSPQAPPSSGLVAPGVASPSTGALRAGRLLREIDTFRSAAKAAAPRTVAASSDGDRFGDPAVSAGQPAGTPAMDLETAFRGETEEDAAAARGAAADEGPSREAPEQPDDSRLRQQLFEIARNNLSVNAGQPGVPVRVEVGVFRPRWLGWNGDAPPELVFERTVRVDGVGYTQGFWVDWPALRAELLAVAVRLVPGAALQPVRGPAAPATNALATIPVRLDTPGLVSGAAGSSPTRITLAVTWIATLVALIAIGLVLRAATRLADRRGRFVTAVSHELRSPLTTFRLYADLLHAGGDDPGARTRYVEALRREASRLGTVVENVLAYAGLATRPPESEPSRFGDLLGATTPPLVDRAEAADASLEVSVGPDAEGASVTASPGSLERILSNLVDNACRYGLTETERTISLTAHAEAGWVVITVATVVPACHRTSGRGSSPSSPEAPAPETTGASGSGLPSRGPWRGPRAAI
jgi:signal transduction histidine kinase